MVSTSRRGFLRGMAGASLFGAGGCLSGFSTARKPGQKIRLAAVGIWGKGYSDWMPMMKSGQCELVALCDVDGSYRKNIAEKADFKQLGIDLGRIPFYSDYRRLLDDAEKLGIDAMTVSTTDHMHAPIAISAMKKGIHVYVQKPLVRTLWELDYFKKTAKDNGVVTQMGNQGSSLEGLRRGVEVLNSGILGDVTEVHVWTNRPVWPQGKNAGTITQGGADKIPADFNWACWLGTAKERPFKGDIPENVKVHNPWNIGRHVYHPFNWRGYFDFGCGAFGDMACHTMNLPFRGLELGIVTKAELKLIEDKDPLNIAFPMKTTVALTYAARESKVRPGVKLPAVRLYWYDGDQQPSAELMPQVVAAQGKVPRTGCLVVGSKGILCSTNDYGGDSFLALNDEKKVLNVKDHPACKGIAHTIPYRGDSVAGQASGPGAKAVSADGQYIEFLDAIRGNGPVYAATGSRAYSDVDYSIPQMEGILVGVTAQRVGGTLYWSSKNQRFDRSDANDLIKPYIRKGFEF